MPGEIPQLLTDKSFKRLNLALLPTLALAMHAVLSHYYPPLDRCAFSRGIIYSRLGAAGRAEQGKGGMNSKEV